MACVNEAGALLEMESTIEKGSQDLVMIGDFFLTEPIKLTKFELVVVILIRD
ncbi:MAG: hypothetical protein H6695_12690 [Deferribacteres bacterium]|nr:hypothetical protein [candidate division KSB1 bacterium]MCB9511040.1 hypothetical protein [Deferribacteres bacterium]